MANTGKIIWIDLGTTNSCIAFMEWGSPKVIPSAEWNRTTPSVVASKWDEVLVWIPAKRQAVTNTEWTIFSAKRFIWRKYDEVKDEIKNVPYHVVKWKDWECLIKFNWKNVRPEEISAKVLEKLKSDAEKFLGWTVDRAVITVPAYFNDDQRQATINAWKIAWLKVERLVNEPTAAALSYWLGKKKNEKVVVYDFWGWTFDVSILEISDEWTFEVLSTNWDTHLGWDDLDKALFEYVISEFMKQEWVDLKKDPMALQRVRDAAETAKKELSTATETEINLPYVTMDASGPKNLLMKITRAKFEELISPYVEKTLDPCKKVLEDAWLKKWDIDEILLVWGSTRVPMVIRKVEEFFGKKPNSWINPDEAVAMWAAIQAWIIGWDVQDVLLLDVAPLSLWIETLGWVTTKMIERNTTIPASKTQTYSTAVDNQPSVEIHVLQWEREMAVDNKSLWRFVLEWIAPAPRWVPQIDVTFDIDANWVLNVTAKDKWTWKEQKITIQWSTWMDEAEVEALVKEAEAKREEDKAKKEAIEARNLADSTVYQSEKTLKENADKIKEEDKKEAEDKIAALKKILENTEANKEEITKANEELNTIMMKVWQDIYAKKDENNWDWVKDSQKKDDNNDVEDADVEEEKK